MQAEQRPQLDYRSPHTMAMREPFSVAGFVGGLIVTVGLAIILLLVAPRCEQVFKDFGMKLPIATVVVLSLGRFTRAGGWMLLPLIPVITGFLFALIGSPSHQTIADAQVRHRLRRMWATRLTIFTVLLIGLVTALALFMPMISLIRAVSGGGKR